MTGAADALSAAVLRPPEAELRIASVRLCERALTVWQPWAGMIADGRKSIEMRRRRTEYRGGLLIHAGQHAGAREHGVIGLAWLSEDRPLAESDLPAAGLRVMEAGRRAWVLERAERLPGRIEWPGRQGLWRPPPGLLDLVADVRAWGGTISAPAARCGFELVLPGVVGAGGAYGGWELRGASRSTDRVEVIGDRCRYQRRGLPAIAVCGTAAEVTRLFAVLDEELRV